MGNCTRCNSRKVVGVSFGAIVVFGSAIVTVWIVHARYETYLQGILQKHRKELNCAECTRKSAAVVQPTSVKCSMMKEECGLLGWKIGVSQTVPRHCMNNHTLISDISKIVGTEYRQSRARFADEALIERSNSHIFDKAADIEDVMYRSPRDIVQSYPTATQDYTDGWRSATGYCCHKRTYSVTVRPDVSFKNESLVILEDGFFEIHAKLTFECVEANHRRENIHMEVLLRRKGSKPILKKVEKAKCDITGDLTTMFLNGLFRMIKGSEIVMRFAASPNIVRSANGPFQFKSYLGIVHVGRYN